jgi:hypothetical protein
MTALKAAAIELARRAVAVFPCAVNGKVPLTPHGCKDASTIEAQVDAWWTEEPSANLGIACGPSKLVVIDVDMRPDLDGQSSLALLEAELGRLPLTRRATTPSGGEHVYFKAPGEDVEIRNSAGKVGVGIDIRADGGYVIAPPSVYGGKVYAWSTKHSVAELPAPWIELLRSKPPETWAFASRPPPKTNGKRAEAYYWSALNNEGEELARTPEGSRNHALNEFGFKLGTLVHLGLDEQLIRDMALWAMSQWSWTRGRPDRRKDQDTLARAVRDGKQNPRKWES